MDFSVGNWYVWYIYLINYLGVKNWVEPKLNNFYVKVRMIYGKNYVEPSYNVIYTKQISNHHFHKFFFSKISRNSFLLKCFIHRELNASNIILSCRYFCGFLGNFPVVYFCAVNNVWNYQQFLFAIILKFTSFYLGKYFWVSKVILNMLLWKFWKGIWWRVPQEK